MKNSHHEHTVTKTFMQLLKSANAVPSEFTNEKNRPTCKRRSTRYSSTRSSFSSSALAFNQRTWIGYVVPRVAKEV